MTTTADSQFPLIVSTQTAPMRRAARLRTRILLTLAAITLLALGLRLLNLDQIGDGNTYYTAAVESMLQSWRNFFFVAAEPGGSVSVDKPPLGLWVQAIFAAVLGVSGVSVTLPQILAGTLSVPLLFALVRRYFGDWPSLLAALVLAITPVAVAVDSNNTMDAQLVLVLLLAAWAFIRATDTGRPRWLIAGAVLVGLGFNIKMLQAFLPLPAFYALYLFGAQVSLRRRIGHLLVATAALLIVSLSWAVIVDLTPADQRPYVGSSETNSVLELMIGYNGLGRLLGLNAVGSGDGPDGAAAAPPANAALPSGMPGGMTAGETGTAGPLRLFTAPLSNEIAWLLPLALLALAAAFVSRRIRFPLNDTQQGALLFGGWLAIGVVFFSLASFFHAYYLTMLAPPVAAGMAACAWMIGRFAARRPRLAALILAIAAVGTVAYQGYNATLYGVAPLPWLIAGGVLLLIGLAALAFAPAHLRRALALGPLFAAMLIIPAYWTAQTATTASNAVLPHAWNGTTEDAMMRGGLFAAVDAPSADEGSDLVAYLQPRTEGLDWMLAVSSSMTGAPLVLETGRGVMYLGGFNGQDQAVTADQLAQYVAEGRLRYVLDDGSLQASKPEIGAYLTSQCTAVEDIDLSADFVRMGPMAGGMPQGGTMALPPGFEPPAGFELSVGGELPAGFEPPAGMNLFGGAAATPTLYACAG